MNFKEEYQKKLCSQAEIYQYIHDGDYIGTGFAGCEPIAFFKGLHTIADRISHIDISHSLEMLHYEFQEEPYREKFTSETFFLMGPGRKAMTAGAAVYVPGNLHHAAIRQVESQEFDVFVCAVSPMDELGYFRTSLCSIAEDLYANAAKQIVLEVVPNMPVIYGENTIHISDVTAVFESDRPVPMVNSVALTEEDIQIGQYVAPLVEDGSTIQLGIGAIPDAIAKAFMDKKDLGIHTEMITNSVADLLEAGVVTGRKKTLHKGKVIGTFALGNKKLYDILAENPAVAIMPGQYVNDPSVIAQNDRMVSINTAICVDFTGQVASESIGPRQYSGSGGQSDTAIGAIHAKGGKSIIALHSTAKNGEVSTINPYLPLGSIVTLSRNNIDYIVTEYGVAEMKNRSTAYRAKALIDIAHPKFREELLRQAKELGYLS